MIGTAFKGINAGDRVRFLSYNGKNRDGSTDWKEKSGRAISLLIYPTHVVVDDGSDNGAYVDKDNYVSHKSGKRR